MPFKSPAQRRFLWAKHPEIARRWESEMATTGTFGNMLNERMAVKKPMKDTAKKTNYWAKMVKKG